MRMHFDNVQERELERAFDSIPDANRGVKMTIVSRHRSQSHRVAFEVRLTGDGVRNKHRTADNVDYAATHDDWGHLTAALYDLDVSAKIGPYHSRAHFHTVTDNKYLTW
jgi:hypothetical protein